jgi:hypothetical protein
MFYREYDPQRDQEAVHQIWREVGWIGPKAPENVPGNYVAGGRGIVADLNGRAECLVITVPGDVQYLSEQLPFRCIAAVTTSHLARKQGLAGRLTAASIAESAHAGSAVCGLGMFEQGYYNQFGMGTGSYEVRAVFDPARLKLTNRARVPVRISLPELPLAHACRLLRRRCHGSCSLYPATETAFLASWDGEESFGLGYADRPDGTLSHVIWLGSDSRINGPYHAAFLAYETDAQLLELLALVKSLGDQIFSVKMNEPPGVQLQDFIEQPNRQFSLTEGGRFASRLECHPWWQMRICDLFVCLAKTHLLGPTLRFNLNLTDPITKYLEDEQPWQGISGEYIVTLGEESGAVLGSDPALPTLDASVGAFTRLWLGVRPATGLAVTDELHGAPELLRQLDETIRVPQPHPDWGF